MSWTARAAALGASAAVAATLCAEPRALATDHRDAPAAAAAPETDIGDVYAWVSGDKMTLNFIMTVFPGAGPTAKFSDSVYYVFHTSSRDKYKNPSTPPVPIDITCKFDAAQNVQCWAAGEYVSGNPSRSSGVYSPSGLLRVFAGRRQDAAFFNLDGLNAFRGVVKTGLQNGQITNTDAEGCPKAIPNRPALLAQLKEKPGMPGSVPVNAYGNQNVLALVVSMDTMLLSQGAPIVSVWGAIHRVQ